MLTNNLSMYCQNCRGIRTKLHTLFMNILSFSFDVIILSETWLTSNITDNEFIDDRYIVFRDDRDRIASNRQDGGGVLIAVLRELRPIRLITRPAHAGIEHVVVQLPASHPGRRHVISAVYIPPRTHEHVYASHLDMLQNILNDPCTESFYLGGDYNLPDIEWLHSDGRMLAHSTNSINRCLFNFMSATNATQYNAVKNNLGRILDLFLSNVESQIQSGMELLPPDPHHPPFSVFTSLETLFTPMKRHNSKRYNYHKANYDLINCELKKIDWEVVLGPQSVEQSVYSFYEIIYGLIRLHAPYARPRTARFPIWYSASLINTFRKKERAWIRWKKFQNLSDYEQFSNHRRFFKTESVRCFKKYIASVENSISLNVKHFWSYISNRKGKGVVPANMYYKDTFSNSPNIICNLFSSFFNSVYEPSNFDPHNWEPPHFSSDESTCLSNIYLSKDKINRALVTLDVTKGSGPDGLPPSFLKKTADSICIPLHIIFNKCLRHGTFPCAWKCAFITPVYKSGDRSNIENYRPISILSTLSKLFESLVHSSLFPLLRHLIIPEQHGFVKCRSTTTNLMIFTDFLFKNMDNRVQVDAVYTDFRKAFDKVDHKLLLDKIAFNGIRGNLLRWFASYIFNRTQKVVINGFESDCTFVASGVPQGSV